MKKTILIFAVTLFVFTANAQIDQVKDANVKAQKEMSKADLEAKKQKEKLKGKKEEVNSKKKEISKKMKDNPKEAVKAAVDYAKLTNEEVKEMMSSMSDEEKTAFKRKLKTAKAKASGAMDNVKGDASTKKEKEYVKNAEAAKSNIMEKHGKSEAEIKKMEKMNDDEISKLDPTDQVAAKSVKANSRISQSESKMAGAVSKIEKAKVKLMKAKADGSLSAEEISAFQDKIAKAEEKFKQLGKACKKGRSAIK